MIRRFLALALIGICCAIGGAQQTPQSLTSKQRLEGYQRNRAAIKQVVEQTVVSVRAPNDHLKRADSYYPILYQFNTEIAQAKQNKDRARIEELTRHLEMLLDKGLAPTLEDAKFQVESGTHASEFPTVKDQLLAQLDALLNSLSEDTKASTSLQGTKERLLKISLPKN